MRSSLRLPLFTLALPLVPSAFAQEPNEDIQRLEVAGTPVYYRMSHDSGALEILPGPSQMGGAVAAAAGTGSSGPVLCIDNTADPDGFLDALLSAPGDELVDWGVKRCGGTRLVESITFGYASQAEQLIGGSMTLRLYSGTQGFGTLGTELLSIPLAGLPSDGPIMPSHGLTPFIVEYDLGSAAFFLPEGPVGWGYQMGDGITGPLLVDVGPDVSTQNYLDWYAPGPASNGQLENTFSLSAGGFSDDPYENSLYFQILENDGAQTADVQLIPSAANLDYLRSDGGPVLGAPWNVSFESFAPMGSFTTIVVLSGEQAIPALPTSIGDILIDVPGHLIAVSFSADGIEHSFDIPEDPTLLGRSVFAQGVVVQPMGEELTNGLAGTFGF